MNPLPFAIIDNLRLGSNQKHIKSTLNLEFSMTIPAQSAAAAHTPKTSSGENKLVWVELGRGLAALMVAIVHASAMMKELQYSGKAFMKDWFFAGFLGVDFFFVLSGFIILYVHFNDVARPSRAMRYGWRRITRIFPTYWIILSLALVVNLAIQRDKAPVSGLWLMQQFSLVFGAEPWLGPAWTLRFELVFYALFSVLLFHRRLGLAVLAAWFLTISYVSLQVEVFASSDYRNTMWHIFTSPYNYNFFMGMALAYASRTGRGLKLLTAVFALLGTAFILWSLQHGMEWHKFIRYPGCGAVCASLLGLLLMINKRGWHLPSPFVWLGSISYSLYLCHLLFMGTFLAVLARLGLYEHIPEGLIFIGQLIVAIICASIIFRLLETPLLKWAHSKFNQ
jgi:exopolysaccharide production protein ExoZ